MKQKHLQFFTLGTLVLVTPAVADVIYSNLKDISIPANYDGLYLNVETGVSNTPSNLGAGVAGWDINPFYGGRAFANSPDFQPVRSGTTSSSSILNLVEGTTVGSGSVYSTFTWDHDNNVNTPQVPGYGGSQMLSGSGGNFTAGTEGYLGFRLNGANYGSMRVVLTNNSSGAMIKDWAYDENGLSVEVGAIKQDGQDIILSSGFTLAASSPLIDTGGATNLVKNGSGTNILKSASTYTGTTTINDGTLQLGAGSTTGTLSTSSAIVNNGNLTINRSNAVTQGTDFSGAAISGTGSFTQAGTGTTTLNAVNSYTGVTTVSAGTLVLASNAAAGTSAGGIAVTGALASTLQINAGITTADNITFSNTHAASSVKRDVTAAGTYTTGTSGNLTSSFTGGQDDTTAQILGGTAIGVDRTLEMLFKDTSAATNDGIRRSDVFTTAGTSTDTYVIQLSTGSLAADSVLGWLDGTTWVNAGTGTFYATAFADLTTHALGSYGYDSGNVWAVVNYSGSFAAIPEPTSAIVGLLIGAGLLRRRRSGY